MKRKRGLGLNLSFKLGFTIFLIIAAFLVISGFIFLRTMETAIEEEQEARTHTTATLLTYILTEDIEDDDYLSARKTLEEVITFPGIEYAFLTDANGEIKARASRTQVDQSFYVELSQLASINSSNSRAVDASGSENFFAVTKVKIPRLRGGGAQPDTENLHDYSLPIAGGRLHLGQQSGLNFESIGNLLGSSMRTIILLIPTVILLTLWLIRHYLAPLRLLSMRARRISLGELNAKLPWAQGRELREIALALERLRVSLKVAIDKKR